MLIAVCGIDGAGKTTQIKNIEEYLKRLGKKVFITKQPSNWYRQDERVRMFLNGEIEDENIIKELALFSATDRLRHIYEEIIPKINEGYVVITDRYVFSAYAYFYTRGIKDIEWLKQINRYALEPDVTFYIKIAPKTACERILKRDGDCAKKEEKDVDFLGEVCNVFETQFFGELSEYFVIDGNQDINNVTEDIINVIEQKLNWQE
ncbi:MAG: dTMP kinase [Clostridia bacterium]|nr:dTMP kinase [Clostridia bacterium]